MSHSNSAAETPQQTITRLSVELGAARETIARFESAQKQKGEDEIKIVEKMAFGLTRDQAASVLRRQREHDQAKFGTNAAELAAQKANSAGVKSNATVTATHQ